MSLPFPAAFQRRLASASRRGAIRANSVSSQEKLPLTPPLSSCPQRKWRLVWTRARRSRSSSRLRAAARIRVALSLSSLCDAPSSRSFNSSPVAPGTSPKVVVTTLS